MSSPPANGGDRIVYTTKEILADINDKLSRQSQLTEQMERRVTALENRVDGHERALTEMVPKLKEFVEKMNVQKAVEDALEAKKVGIATADRVLVGGFTILIVFLTAILPRLFG